MENRRVFLASLPAIVLAPAAFAECERTTRATEGPFWRANAPKSPNLRQSFTGKALEVSGIVRAAGCAPLANAVVEVWQADDHGKYDLDYDDGRTFLRASLRTDANGRYSFVTIKPAPYGMSGSMRPAHIHFKVRAEGQRELVTQLYFAGDPYLDRDPLDAVHPDLVVAPKRVGQVERVEFNLAL